MVAVTAADQLTAAEIHAEGGAEDAVLKVVGCKCVSGEEYVDVSFADHCGDCIGGSGVNDCRSADEGNFLSGCFDLEKFLCDLADHGFARPLRGDIASHELEDAYLTRSFGEIHADTLFSDDDEVSGEEFALYCAGCGPVLCVNADECIHFHVLYRNPFPFVVDVGRVVGCGVEAFRCNFCFDDVFEGDFCFSGDQNTKTAQFADDLRELFWGFRGDLHPCVTRVGFLPAEGKLLGFKVSVVLDNAVHDFGKNS